MAGNARLDARTLTAHPMQLQEIRDVDVRKHKGRGLKNVSSQQEASFEGEVVDLTSDGRGVVKRPDGKVFFVQGAWLGERALIKPLSSKGKIGFAVVEHMIEPSPARQPSPCEHHGFSSSDCGGCPWAFVSYEAQWDAKHARVSQALRRLQPESAVEVEVLMADDAEKAKARSSRNLSENKGYSAAKVAAEMIDVMKGL